MLSLSEDKLSDLEVCLLTVWVLDIRDRLAMEHFRSLDLGFLEPCLL